MLSVGELPREALSVSICHSREKDSNCVTHVLHNIACFRRKEKIACIRHGNTIRRVSIIDFYNLREDMDTPAMYVSVSVTSTIYDSYRTLCSTIIMYDFVLFPKSAGPCLPGATRLWGIFYFIHFLLLL
jgi:hypothetical protein